MSYLFFDSSALVKRYLTERGRRWVQGLTDPAAGNTIIIAEVTQVETAAAIAARHRAPGGISRADRDALVTLLINHVTNEYSIVPISTDIILRALDLTQIYRLRGYDAVQLAAASVSNTALLAAGQPALTFISADNDLNAAATADGIAADDPNAHP